MRFIPYERHIFSTSFTYVLWSVTVPWLSTLYVSSHGAGALQITMGFFFSWLVSRELSDQGKKNKCECLTLIGAGGVLISLLVLIQASGVTVPGFTPAISPEFRATGTLGNPNWTAAFLLPLTPVLMGVRSTCVEEKGSRIKIYLCTAMIVLISSATLFTRSKAGVVSLAAGVIVYGLFSIRLQRRSVVLLITGFMAGVSAFLIWSVSTSLFQTLTWTRGRIFLWKACLLLIARHPVTGSGLGGFLPSYPQVLPKLINGDPQVYMPLGRIEFAYNDILQTAVDAGIPAAILLLILLFCLFRRAFGSGDSLSRGVGSGLAALTVYGCFDSPLQLPATLALWWYFIGWLMAGNSPDTGKTNETSFHRRIVHVVFLSCVALLGLFQAIRFTGVDLMWTRGASALKRNDRTAASESMLTAARMVPENAKLLSETAKTLMFDHKPHEALTAIRQALMTGFSFEDRFLELKILKQVNKAEESEFGWKSMVHDYPGLFTPHIELARVFIRERNFSAARSELETVLRIRQHDEIGRAHV
jgi:O-antigen ligase